jgi:uncharacterized protein YjcR
MDLGGISTTAHVHHFFKLWVALDLDRRLWKNIDLSPRGQKTTLHICLNVDVDNHKLKWNTPVKNMNSTNEAVAHLQASHNDTALLCGEVWDIIPNRMSSAILAILLMEEWQKVIHSNQIQKKASKRQQGDLCQFITICNTNTREENYRATGELLHSGRLQTN